MREMYGEPEESTTGESSLTRVGTAFAAIVIVGLLFLCLRFALNSAGGDRQERVATGARPRSVVSAAAPSRPNPGSPGGLWRAPALSPSAARPQTAPPPPMPPAAPPAPMGDPIFASAEEQQTVRAFLKEMRAAYEAARTLGGSDAPRAAAAGVIRPLSVSPTAERARRSEQDVEAASSDAVRNGDIPLEQFVPEERPSSSPALPPAQMRAQADALGVLITLNAHPGRYPAPLQDDVRDFAREMRAFLATMSLAATASPEEAGAYRAAAEPRLARASVLLLRLEDMAKTGVLPARPHS